MAVSCDLKSCVTDISSCPICFELFNNPKSLPCLHTFCLLCIERHYQDKPPGAEVSCPVCRKKFLIPLEGLSTGLLHNFFIQSLVDARKTASDIATEVPCEVCLEEADGDAGSVPDATMFCIDCKQKLCEQCSKPHRRMKGGAHKVVAVGEAAHSHVTETRGRFCDKHSEETVKLYCFDCKSNICLVCSAVEHDQHKRQELMKAAKEFRVQIDDDLQRVSEIICKMHEEVKHLNEDSCRSMSEIEEVEMKIGLQVEVLKQLVDVHASDLLNELHSIKLKTCKEIENQKEMTELALLALETFKTYCTELIEKGQPCDITRAANDMHARATELLQSDAFLDGFCNVPYIAYMQADFQQVMESTGHKNVIGQIQTLTSKDVPVPDQCQLLDNACGVGLKFPSHQLDTVLDQHSQIVVDIVDTKDANWDNSVVKLTEQVSPMKLEEENVCGALKLDDKLSAMLNSLRRSNVELMEQVKALSATERALQEQLQQMTDSEHLLKEHLLSESHVIRRLPLGKIVNGVTMLDNVLYVLRSGTPVVEIYDGDSCKLLHRMSVPGLSEDYGDMTSCEYQHCLYISDCDNYTVFKLDSLVDCRCSVTRWPVNNHPLGLSVTCTHNVLVTFDEINTVAEFTTDGRHLREVKLPFGFCHPWRAVQLASENFVVVYGGDDDNKHGVVIIDANGYVVQSYGGTKGSGTVAQLNQPSYVVVDKDGFIYVCDNNNHRIILLNPFLRYVREILSPIHFKRSTDVLYLDRSRRRLYASDGKSVLMADL